MPLLVCKSFLAAIAALFLLGTPAKDAGAAWLCGQQLDGRSDISYFSCESSYHHGGEMDGQASASCAIHFGDGGNARENFDRIYNVGIFLRNGRGDELRVDGRWIWRGTTYTNADVWQDDLRNMRGSGFAARFITEWKDGDTAFDSGWMRCDSP